MLNYKRGAAFKKGVKRFSVFVFSNNSVPVGARREAEEAPISNRSGEVLILVLLNNQKPRHCLIVLPLMTCRLVLIIMTFHIEFSRNLKASFLNLFWRHFNLESCMKIWSPKKRGEMNINLNIYFFKIHFCISHIIIHIEYSLFHIYYICK